MLDSSRNTQGSSDTEDSTASMDSADSADSTADHLMKSSAEEKDEPGDPLDPPGGCPDPNNCRVPKLAAWTPTLSSERPPRRAA